MEPHEIPPVVNSKAGGIHMRDKNSNQANDTSPSGFPGQGTSSGSEPDQNQTFFELEDDFDTPETAELTQKEWRMRSMLEAFSVRKTEEAWSVGLSDEENELPDELQEDAEAILNFEPDVLPELKPLHLAAATDKVVQSDSIMVNELDEGQTMQADQTIVQVHPCTNVPCQCNVSGSDFCADFCQLVDPSEDDRHCGCGHTACDITKELGNEGTFASSGS